MTKLSWTCTKCGLWTTVLKERLETVDSIPQLICKLCNHNSTDELIASEPTYPITCIEMIPIIPGVPG